MGSAVAPATAGERTWGIYRLVASLEGRQTRVRAYAGPHCVAQGSAAGLEAAFAVTVGHLQRRQQTFHNQRIAGVPRAEEFRDLIAVLPQASRSRLLHLFDNHRRLGDASASDIGRAAGKDCTHVWWAYERFGRKVASALAGAVPNDAPPDLFGGRWVLTFARLNRSSPLQDWRIVLRPELREALAELGLGQGRAAA